LVRRAPFRVATRPGERTARTRNFDAPEHRRLKGGKLLAKGMPAAAELALRSEL
jgi:hypothetical protein